MTYEILMLIGVFATVVLCIVGLYGLAAKPDPIKRRLAATSSQNIGLEGEGASAHGSTEEKLLRFLRPLTQKMGSKEKSFQSTARMKMIKAGFYGSAAVEKYYAWRLTLAVACPVLGILITSLILGNQSPNVMLITIVGGTTVGFYLPVVLVRNVISQRREATRMGLPDALDMLLVCVEAGASLSAAFRKVSLELEGVHPVLGEHMRMISLELQAGAGRAQALKNFGERSDVNDVRSLVTLLIQSEALGTSLAKSLRVYSEELRVARMLRAEEKANRLPATLSIPLVLFILPCLMMLIMTPIIIRVVRVLLPV